MRRLFILGTIFVGLLVAFGVAGENGLQTARPAEAVQTTTTWMWPTSGGITVPGNGPTTQTDPAPAPCTSCYITSIVPDLVYMSDPNHSDGTTANFNGNDPVPGIDNVWMHHMAVVDYCPATGLTQFFASGNERTTWSVPAGYGYWEGANCSWYVNYHIHNVSTNTRNVALKLVVTYQTGVTLTPVTPIWLDMSNQAPPNSSEFTVPDGYSDTHTGSGGTHINNDWTSNIQGQIVAIGGHVHGYGISVSAYNNRLGDYICTSISGYGTGSRYWPQGGANTPGHPAAGNQVTLNPAYWEANGTPDDRYHIQAMTTCNPTPAQSIICKNDVIRLHTQYNNGSGFPILDAMGIIVGEVATNLPDTGNTGTIDACKDSDSDGVVNSADNCPNWANPTQALPSWPVPSGESDCDGFPNTVAAPQLASEVYLGTDPLKHCAADTIQNNEPPPDKWPVDFNNDQLVSGGDFLVFAPVYGHGSPGHPPLTTADQRYDLNGDGKISGGDFLVFSPFYGKRCA